KSFGRVWHVAQTGKIKNLHAMTGFFTHDKGVVFINFNIAPCAVAGMSRQFSQINRIHRIRNVDKSSAVVQSHKGIFFSVGRVCPSQGIVAGGSIEGVQVEMSHQVIYATGINTSHKVYTWSLSKV